MVSMKHVADMADVSVSTVSHVVNETRHVSPPTRERVLDAIDALDYTPNAIARGLRRNETKTIGLIIPDNSNPFFGEIARGAEDAGYRHGYSVILCNSADDIQRELSYLEALVSKKVDGIVFIAVGLSAEHIQPVIERGTPVVIVDRKLAGVEAGRVLADNYKGGYEATRHLLDLGHERIACIIGPSELTPSSDRVHGYRVALEEAGLKFDERLVMKGDFTYRGGIQGANRLMQLPEPPTAIFVCNDTMCIGALRALRERGLRVPDDVSLVGFDDIALAAFAHPSLTTVRQPKYEKGEMVVERLIDRISDDEPEQIEEILLDVELIIRESTAPNSNG